MKSLSIAFAFAVLSLASCQKETILEPVQTPSAISNDPNVVISATQTPTSPAAQTWILEDTPYAATVASNALGQQTIQLTSGVKVVSGIASSVSNLPTQVIDVFASLNVAIPADAKVWQTSTGGFLVEIPQTGGSTRVFWFNNWYGLRSIGHIQN